MTNATSEKTFLGHPRGLFLLFGTELWERFSYYAMRAILVLYLVDKVRSQGGYGLGWDEADAINLYGTFTMSVFLTPLIGGWLADNFLGQRRAILIGGALMALGQFTLGTPHAWVPGHEELAFYVGLTLLIAGNGFFKPNISTMVGDLYRTGDHRRDGAFTIFYMGINIGAFLSGIIVGSVVDYFDKDYQAGFICAGIGMVISIIIQLLFARRLLGDVGLAPVKNKDNAGTQQPKQPLTKEEIDRIKVILVMGLFTIIFWAGFEQAGGLMNIYADRFTDRTIGDFTVPTTWFQSLNPLFIVLCAPILGALWIKMGSKEPSSPVKFGFGLLLMGFGFIFMIGAAMQQGQEGAKASMWWLVAAYLFHTLGELCLSPIGLSMVTKLAPVKLASLFMGVWFLFTALANKAAGVIGSLIGIEGQEASFTEQCQSQGLASGSALKTCIQGLKDNLMVDKSMAIFLGIMITAAISAVILWLISGKLIKWMHGAEGHSEDKLTEELEVVSDHEAAPEKHLS